MVNTKNMTSILVTSHSTSIDFEAQMNPYLIYHLMIPTANLVTLLLAELTNYSSWSTAIFLAL